MRLRRTGGRAIRETTTNECLRQNKDKPKKGVLPTDMTEAGRYHAARTVGDEWICYPWEAIDIEEHDRMAKANGNTI